jgi:recombinase-like zinc beta ribbon protein
VPSLAPSPARADLCPAQCPCERNPSGTWRLGFAVTSILETRSTKPQSTAPAPICFGVKFKDSATDTAPSRFSGISDRLARSTFDLFGIVKRIVDAKAQFRSLAEPWADIGTSTGRSMIAQRLIADNANGKGMMVRGAVRKGEALLAGLLRCGHCGRRLLVSYNGTKGDIGRYHCDATRSNPAAAPCISFGALRVDQAVGVEIVRLLQPLGVEAASLDPCWDHSCRAVLQRRALGD